MNTQKTSLFKAGRAITAGLVAFAIALLSAVTAVTPALAASVGSVAISTSSPTTQEVSSTFDYQVSWSCSGLVGEDCVRPVIEIPITLINPNPAAMQDMSTWGVTFTPPSTSSANFTPTVVRSDTELILRLTSTRTVPAGTQESFIVQVRPHPSTGDGVRFSFGSATINSESFSEATSNRLEGEVVTRLLEPVDKEFLGGLVLSDGTTARATYRITPNIRGVWEPLTDTWSSCVLQDNNQNRWDTARAETIEIVDTLPAQATFVSATGGGIYDPATHTVTWNDCSNYQDLPWYVIVELPAATDSSDPAYTDTITNSVSRSFLDTAGNMRTSEDSVTHDNIFRARPTPELAKCGQGRVTPTTEPAPGGQCAPWRFSPTYAYSGGAGVHYYNIDARRILQGDEVEVTDWMPCASSPTVDGYASEAGCTQPVEELTHLTFTTAPGGVGNRSLSYQTLTLFLSDGTQQDFTPAQPIASLAPLPAPPAGLHYVGFRVVLSGLSLDGSVRVAVQTRLLPGADHDMNLENRARVAVTNDSDGYFFEGDATGIGAVRESVVGTSSAGFSVSGSGIRYSTASFGAFALDPSVALPSYVQVLPAGYVVAGQTTNSILITDSDGRTNRSHYTIEMIPEDTVLGHPALVRITPIPGTPAVPSSPSEGWPYVSVQTTLERTWGAQYGTLATEAFTSIDGSASAIDNCLQYSPRVADDSRDLDGDGLTSGDSGCLAYGTRQFNSTLSAATSVVTKHVRDVHSSSWSGANQVAGITSGEAEYLLHWENAGQPALSDVVLYDLLPHVGDTGATAANQGMRGSEFTPTFNGLSRAVPAGAQVHYSASMNPCRPEVFPTNPGCDNDWTTDPNTLGGVAAVRALRVTLPGEWPSGSNINLAFNMLVPAGTVSGDVAWNTVAQVASSAGSPLVAAETARTGIMMPADVVIEKNSEQSAAPVGVGDTVSYTIDLSNRLATTANGIRVVDDLSGVLQTATFNNDATTDRGTVVWDDVNQQLIWTGNLAVGEAATIHYTVTTTSPTVAPGMRNTVTGQVGSLPTNCTDGTEDGCFALVEVVAPDVQLQKTAQGVTEGSTIAGLTNVTWDYTVRNSGTEPLTDVSVGDSEGVIVTCPSTALDIGESMVCQGTGNVGNGQSYENTGAVIGTGAISGDPASAEDTWSVVISPLSPALTIDKTADGVAEGTPIPALSTVTWNYQVVNAGAEPVSAINVTDSQGVAVTCPATVLAVGASMDCTGTGPIGLGPSYQNTGVVVGTGDLTGAPATATDTWNAEVIPLERAIEVVKSSPDTVEGGTLPAFTTVNWEYLVTNTGEEPVTNLVVTDDQGVAVSCPVTSLAVNESTTCTGSASIGAGPAYRNVATAAAVAEYTGLPVQDQDDWSISVSPLNLDLQLDKRAPAVQEGSWVRPGTMVDWEYIVTNTGDEDLADLQVLDDQGVTVSCPGTMLSAGDSMTCTGTGSIGSGPGYTNIGIAEAVGALSLTPVTAEDDWSVEVREPVTSISVVKGAENALDGGTVRQGTVVNWNYAVTNTGEEPVETLTVTDSQGVQVTCPATELAPAETMVCTGSGPIGAGPDYANTAVATGTGTVTGAEVTAEDTWTTLVQVLLSGIAVIKDAVAYDTGATVPANSDVAWNYTVINIGEDALWRVTVTDDRGVTVTCPDGELAVGASMVCTGAGSVGSDASYTNVGTATGTGAVSDQPVSAESTWTAVLTQDAPPEAPTPAEPVTPQAPSDPPGMLELTGGATITVFGAISGGLLLAGLLLLLVNRLRRIRGGHR